MTCIVGLEAADGAAWLAADRFLGTEGLRDRMDVPKIARVGPLAVGFCGGMREGQVLEWLLDPRPRRAGEPMLHYLAAVVVRPMRLAHKRLELTVGADFAGLIAGYGRVYTLDHDGGLSRSAHGYDACGAAARFALGGFAATAGLALEPRDRLERVLGGVAQHSNYCCDPFDFLRVPPKAPRATKGHRT